MGGTCFWPAIAAMGMKAVCQGLTTSIGEMYEYDLNRITPELIAEAGDEIAKYIFEKSGFYLGIAATIICTSIGRAVLLLLAAFHKRVTCCLTPSAVLCVNVFT